jgi:hypothetical protein
MIQWWFYVAAVFAAAFLVNGIPHFVQGVSGKPFPSPFSGGPGTLDSPERNVFWGGGNLVVGGVLLWLIRDGLGDPVIVIELVVAGIGFGAMLGRLFSGPGRGRQD